MDKVQNELERVKADLEVMKNAAGLEQEYTWSEVFFSVITGFFGLFLAALDFFVLKARNPHSSIYLLCLLLFPMLLAIIVYNKKKNRRLQRAGRRFFWGRGIISILFIWGLIAWSEKFHFSFDDIFMGAFFVIVGFETGIESFCRSQNLYGLTTAIPMMTLGFLMPIFPFYIITMFGLMMAISSFAYSGVIVNVIRRQKVSNGTD